MIRYSLGSWGISLYWWGGINRTIFPYALAYCIFCCVIYWSKIQLAIEVDEEDTSLHNGLRGIMGFLAFLLVFRLNQSFLRHLQGVSHAGALFNALELLVSNCCVNMQGPKGPPGEPLNRGNLASTSSFSAPFKGRAALGEDPDVQLADRRATELGLAAKINCIRLTLAFAISVSLHFQMCDAVCDTTGVLDELELTQIVFLYCRLRALLYAEEMEFVDKAFAVFCEREGAATIQDIIFGRQGDNASVYRAELSRHFIRPADSQYMLGHPEEDPHGGITITPIPKVIMLILMNSLSIPIDQHWGYSNRMWSIFLRMEAAIMNDFTALHNLIRAPTPLAYLQHCRVLLMFFACAYPCSIDTSRGFVDNVIVPSATVWAMLGFEFLGNMLENPLGNDEMDLDFGELVHDLEAFMEYAFETTEAMQDKLGTALRRTMMNFHMTAAAADECQKPVEQGPSGKFRTYFHWRPMPTALSSQLLGIHGQIDVWHHLSLKFGKAGAGLRTFLRRSIRRVHHRGAYEQVKQDELLASGRADLNKDPKHVCHYLVFNGAAASEPSNGVNCTSDSLQDNSGSRDSASATTNWATRASRLLDGHIAASLLSAGTDEDTERSQVVSFDDYILHAANHAEDGKRSKSDGRPNILRALTVPSVALRAFGALPIDRQAARADVHESGEQLFASNASSSVSPQAPLMANVADQNNCRSPGHSVSSSPASRKTPYGS